MKGLNNLLIDYPLLHIFGIFMEFSIVPSGSKWYTVWSNSFSLGKYGILKKSSSFKSFDSSIGPTFCCIQYSFLSSGGDARLEFHWSYLHLQVFLRLILWLKMPHNYFLCWGSVPHRLVLYITSFKVFGNFQRHKGMSISS